jgi:hypothetical protein
MIIAIGFGFLALLSIISIVASAEDPERDHDRSQNPLYWTLVARR